MNASNQTILFLLAILTGVLLFWRNDRNAPSADPLQSDPGNVTTNYDYFLEDVVATRFTDTGPKLYKLEAEQITHFPNGNRAELLNPDFTRFPPDSAPVRLTSRAGSLVPGSSAEADILMLRNNVELARTLDNGQLLTVRTSSLNMNTGTGTASTPDPVTLDTATSHLAGTGMRITQNEDRIELLTNVRGQHD